MSFFAWHAWYSCIYICPVIVLTTKQKWAIEQNDNGQEFVLVLEDRTEVKNQHEAGKLTIVSEIDDKGKLKTTEPLEANQAAFLKFNSKDGLLKNFMTNFLKQFNNPSHFGLYKVLASLCVDSRISNGDGYGHEVTLLPIEHLL